MCEGTTEGETSHSLLTWCTAKLSLIDGNLSRLVLGAITKKNLLVKLPPVKIFAETENRNETKLSETERFLK